MNEILTREQMLEFHLAEQELHRTAVIVNTANAETAGCAGHAMMRARDHFYELAWRYRHGLIAGTEALYRERAAHQEELSRLANMHRLERERWEQKTGLTAENAKSAEK